MRFNVTLTKPQAQSLKRLYDRDPTVSPSFLRFRHQVTVYRDYAGLIWKQMFIGIEKDGYIHS